MTRRPRLSARLLMSGLASRMSDVRGTDRVQFADLRTSMDDARTALSIACGVPLDELDPLRGYDLTRRAYNHVRESWSRIEDSDWSREHMAAARANWRRWRPEWDDDWTLAPPIPPRPTR